MHISTGLWPLAVFAAAATLLVALLLVLSHFLGPRRRTRATHEPFESGVVPAGPARLRFSANFYLVAMFFVIFDLEAVFLYAWAIAVREAGWAGYVEALIFITILLAALVYLARTGGLAWGPTSSTTRQRARR